MVEQGFQATFICKNCESKIYDVTVPRNISVEKFSESCSNCSN